MNLRDLAGQVFSETDRVIQLPFSSETETELALDYVEQFKLPGATWDFKVPQAEGLYSIHKFGGAVLALGVGAGKTLVAWLAGRAAGAAKVVILLRKADERSYEKEIALYRDQFDPGPCEIHLVFYTTLSDPRFGAILEEIAPDLIVADEAQNLISDSARASRFWRYRSAHPEITCVFMSGTLFKKSIADAAGISEAALGARSPLPHPGTQHLEVWQHVLDPRGMASADERAWFESKVIRPMGVDPNLQGQLESARLAAGRRFVGSEGVVFSPAASTDMLLTINRVRVPLPEHLATVMAQVKKDRMIPNGEDLISTDMQLAVVTRMLATGFYNRWAWEDVPGGRDEEWLARRSAWGRILVRELAQNRRAGYDSEKLIGDQVLLEAIEDPRLVRSSTLHSNRWAWGEVQHRPEPASTPVWVDKFLVDYVCEMYRDSPVILWYSHQAWEQELEARGIPVYGAGTFLEGPERLVAASIQVHGTGRNLQAWNHAVVLECPTDGIAWEQLLGRLHRQGQTRPVQFDLLVTHDSISKAIRAGIENAKFIQSMQMTPQRLLTATWV